MRFAVQSILVAALLFVGNTADPASAVRDGARSMDAFVIGHEATDLPAFSRSLSTASGCDWQFYAASISHYWTMPSGQPVSEDSLNMRFTPVGTQYLQTITLLLYSGLPGFSNSSGEGVDVIIWNDDGSGLPGTEVSRINIPGPELQFYPDVQYLNVPHLNLAFSSDFHVGVTVVNKSEDKIGLVSDACENPLRRSSFSKGGLWTLIDDEPTIACDYNFQICVELCDGINCVDTTLFAVDGDATDDRFGTAVCGGQDFDLDGHPDYAVGAPYWSYGGTPYGAVFLFSGLTGNLRFIVTGMQDEYGSSVCMMPDIDNSGYPEMVIGAPAYDNERGRVHIRTYDGSTWSTLYTLYGTATGDRFGHAVSTGDIDGDGVPDIVVGAPGADVNGNVNAGRVSVYSGATGTFLYHDERTTLYPGERYGHAVDATGDIYTDDAANEVLVGAPFASVSPYLNAGRIAVLDPGKLAGGVIWDENDAFFGLSVAFLGGFSNSFSNGGFVFGAPGLSSGRGAVMVYSVPWVYITTIEGYQPGELFGQSVARIGDINGDSIPEFAVGAPFNSEAATNAGKVYVYSIQVLPDGSRHVALLTTHTPAPGSTYEECGTTVAGTPATDDDCVPDLLVGSPEANLGTGRSYLVNIINTCEDLCSCCDGRTGNVDMVGEFPTDVDSSDLGALVNYLFSPPGTVELLCELEADVDAQGGPNPVDSSDLGQLVAFLFASPPGSVVLPGCP